MQPITTQLQWDENAERLKIVLPLKRQWPALLAYTALVGVWVVGLGLFVSYLFNPPLPDTVSTAYRVGWRGLILVWLIVWGWVIGRFVLRWWQFYLAGREILFIHPSVLVIRRPVSLFGNTDAYDMRYISPFYRHERYPALAFQYGKTQHVLFALGVAVEEQTVLLNYLNHRFFPQADDSDEEA